MVQTLLNMANVEEGDKELQLPLDVEFNLIMLKQERN